VNEHRPQERRGFPRPRLRNPDDVPAGQSDGDCLFLDYRWFRVPVFRDGSDQGVVKVHVRERERGARGLGARDADSEFFSQFPHPVLRKSRDLFVLFVKVFGDFEVGYQVVVDGWKRVDFFL